MTGFDFIWNKHPGPSPVGHVLPTLQEMQWRLIAVDFEFEELKNHSSLLHTKTQLYESDRDIRDSLDYSVAAASTKSNESVTQFLRKAERLESAINVLVDGMLGNGLNGSDILVNLRDAKDVNSNNTLNDERDYTLYCLYPLKNNEGSRQELSLCCPRLSKSYSNRQHGLGRLLRHEKDGPSSCVRKIT